MSTDSTRRFLKDEELKKLDHLTFTQALCILFIGLKITKKINWPWLVVLSPILIVPAIALIIFSFYVGVDKFGTSTD